MEPNFINKIANQFSVKYADRANLEAHENRSGVIGIKNLFQDLFYYTGREILRVVLLPFRAFSFVVHLVGVIRTLGCNLKAWEELGDSAKLLGSTLVRATIGAPLQIITAVFSSVLQIGHSSGATGRKIAAGLDDFMDSEIEPFVDLIELPAQRAIGENQDEFTEYRQDYIDLRHENAIGRNQDGAEFYKKIINDFYLNERNPKKEENAVNLQCYDQSLFTDLTKTALENVIHSPSVPHFMNKYVNDFNVKTTEIDERGQPIERVRPGLETIAPMDPEERKKAFQSIHTALLSDQDSLVSIQKAIESIFPVDPA